ncbi:peptidoglycan DD-metalloendopeptidase family protein [Accumulibacter sp.]|uniref:peptidoglycan DD-metalloendopeptidase family protein n=1 Tax=Accumulibacter sp. TaxID=2053492 RepID=UPI0035B137E4
MEATIKVILIVLCVFVNTARALDQTETGFFYPVGRANFNTGNGWWLSKAPDYFSGEYHLGVDMLASYGSSVYAVADGVIKRLSPDGSGWGAGNCALAIEHKTYDGIVFTAIYGHLLCTTLPAEKSSVYAGKAIGKVGHWDNGDHLHFGIHPGPYNTIASSHWGRQFITGNWTNPCTGNCLNTFTDPIKFIKTNSAYSKTTEKQTACFMDICWEPGTATCETATSRYRLVHPPYAEHVGADICTELAAKMSYITSAPNLQERVPDNQPSRNWLRWVFDVLGIGPIANAADAQQLKYKFPINTINIYTGTVVAGNARLAVYGAGAGYSTAAVDQTIPSHPDFIVTKTWLETPQGIETYQYGLQESFNTMAQSKNIGDGPCLKGEIQTITGNFYLSKGYKEDAHSGDGAWRRIDSTTTNCLNLEPGETHTETKNTNIQDWITMPGIYNIVYCIDHPQDDHNNGGDHKEKHESNNCSTEAIFEVVAAPYVNVPDVDFIPLGLKFLQTPYYAGDQARFSASIKNQGTVASPKDVRSSYSVECPGTGLIYLTDDGTPASALGPGASVFEENKSPVTLPNASGTCTAYFCVDYQNTVHETDENNNCQSFSFTLAGRPKPNLAITKFEDESGCCTTNTGDRIKPDIWVRNTGPVAPASNVTVIYQINSPVATGNAWWTIGYGGIEPRELPPGGTDEDYMDGRWSIPKDGAWKKQWHTVRACLRADGSTPVGDPNRGDVCATYTRYSKK